MNQQLKDYIDQARLVGDSDEKIRNELENQGWPRAEVFEAFGYEKQKNFQLNNSAAPIGMKDYWHTAYQSFLVIAILQLIFVGMAFAIVATTDPRYLLGQYSVSIFIVSFGVLILSVAFLILLAILFKKHKRIAIPISYVVLSLDIISFGIDLIKSVSPVNGFRFAIILYLLWVTYRAQKQY